MKSTILKIAALFLAATGVVSADSTDYTNFIRQTHIDTGVQVQSPNLEVTGSNEAFSPITFGTYQFDLWTVKHTPLTSYLLDTAFVSTVTPMPTASVNILSGDPYVPIKRTRADQPFTVEVTVDGLLVDDPNAPDAYSGVAFEHHVQSYGDGGTSDGINRNQATLLSESSVATNGVSSLTYQITQVPGEVRTKVRGEERFTVYSLEYNDIPAAQLDSEYIQIWPVESCSLNGVEHGDVVRGGVPNLAVYLEDLYPTSNTYVQVYPGPEQIGTVGTQVEGSVYSWNGTIPTDRTITVSGWDELFDSDGEWTVEVLTETPFGLDRLQWLTFTLDRKIEINGSVTSSE